jgi:hypothetical protein
MGRGGQNFTEKKNAIKTGLLHVYGLLKHYVIKTNHILKYDNIMKFY